MKTINNIIYVAFLTVVLAVGASTANAAPGDLFETDTNSGNIYKFAPDGMRTTFASGLAAPIGLAFDSAGNLFVTNNGDPIDKFAPDGTQSTFAVLDNAAMRGLAFDSAGNLFAADGNNNTIYKFTPDGTQSIFTTGLNAPLGLAFDSTSNLFEADAGSQSIYKFAPDGTQSTFATGLLFVGLAFDNAGNLFATDLNTRSIYKFAPDGTRSTFATALNSPWGLAFDSAGNLLCADFDKVVKFTPDGTRSTFASGLSGGFNFLAFEPATTHAYAAQIQQPINADGTSIFNVRRGVVPVKFTLTQSGVPTCTLPPATIAVTRTAGGTTGPIDESTYIGSADTGSNFRIDSCQYVYNLSASALGVGTYRVDIKITNQVVGSAVFQLK